MTERAYITTRNVIQPVQVVPVVTTYTTYQAYPAYDYKYPINYQVYEPYGPNYHVVWPIVGAVITAVAMALFYILLRRVVNLLLETWHIFSAKRNFLPQALTFVGGLLMAGGIFFDIFGYGYYEGVNPFGPKQTLERHTSVYGFALAGLLMGFGAKLIHGDVYPHGYVQISRHNKRSVVALVLFALFGIIGATMSVNNVFPVFTDGNRNPYWNLSHYVSANISILFGIIFVIAGFMMRKSDVANTSDVIKEILTIFILSFMFGSGLLLSGLTRRVNVLHGFSVFNHWTPVLLIPVAVTLLTCFILIAIGSKFRDIAVWGDNYYVMIDQKITGPFIAGACLFGFGWGLSGLQIATWILHFPVFTLSTSVFYGFFLIIGMYMADFMQNKVK